MERRDNYAIQAVQARQRFLDYDQQKLIAKLNLAHDEEYLYTRMLCQPYRIHRTTADISRRVKGSWVNANSFAETLVLLDLVCDSREDRYLTGRWKNLQAFGHMFHQNLLEDAADPWALRFQDNPAALDRACRAMGGTPLPQGDVAYALELFDALPMAIQLWLGDEEFPPQLRFLLDENAHMYLRYETMHYARGLLLKRLEEEME